MKYPAPLKKGSTIAITAFSTGIAKEHEARYQYVLAYFKSQGFNVVEGECLRGQQKHASAPAQQRADELMSFLLNDDNDAIVPPWGGELAMELLPLLDFDALTKAKPKWVLGFSDVSTITAVLSSKLGWASAHCSNLMDLTSNATESLTAGTLACLSTPYGEHFSQSASAKHTRSWPNIAEDPEAVLQPEIPTQWKWLVKPEKGNTIEGRLIGGCWDTLFHLFATDYLDLDSLSRQYPEGLVLFLENVEMSPVDLARTILNMKFRGVFSCINGLLLGRCAVVDSDNEDDLTYYEVLERHLADLRIPVMIDLDIGHVPPNLTLINGALATVELHDGGRIHQQLIA